MCATVFPSKQPETLYEFDKKYLLGLVHVFLIVEDRFPNSLTYRYKIQLMVDVFNKCVVSLIARTLHLPYLLIGGREVSLPEAEGV